MIMVINDDIKPVAAAARTSTTTNPRSRFSFLGEGGF
jgi:hypothetical protein